MEFEFDPDKSHVNCTQHGIDFVHALTVRQSNVRIISVRRSRVEEVAIYEG